MTEELAQDKPKKLGWFKKYILMQDLREVSDQIVNLFVLCCLCVTFVSGAMTIYWQFSTFFNINLNNLVSIKSNLHVSTYTQKSGKFNHELNGNWYVEINGKRIDYFHIFPGIGRNELATFERLDGESVEVQYLPEDNKFYVVKFTNLDIAHLATNQESVSPQVLKASRITLERLKAMQYQNLYVMPFYALLSTLFFMFIEMLIIRYEVFRKPNIYFIMQPWIPARPVILKGTFRSIGLLSMGVIFFMLNLSVISNFIWRW